MKGIVNLRGRTAQGKTALILEVKERGKKMYCFNCSLHANQFPAQVSTLASSLALPSNPLQQKDFAEELPKHSI